MKSFRELILESKDFSVEFEKATGIKKDKKKIGHGDVYFLKDGSSLVIYPGKSRMEYYDKDMNFITSYTSVKQAIKALEQSGLLNESKIEDAAKEIHHDLLHNVVNKNTAIENYIKSVLKDHGLKDSDKEEVIKLVKAKGYKGGLLNESQIDEGTVSLKVGSNCRFRGETCKVLKDLGNDKYEIEYKNKPVKIKMEGMTPVLNEDSMAKALDTIDMNESNINEAHAKQDEIISALKELKGVEPEALRVALMNRARTNKDGRWQAEYFYGSKKAESKADQQRIVNFMMTMDNWCTEEEVLEAILKFQKEK